MKLLVLGGLRLAEGDFHEQQPLLLLCCLSLTSKTHRGELADLLWVGSSELRLRRKSLSTALRKLRKLVGNSVIDSDGPHVTTSVRTDYHDLVDALEAGRLEEALSLYSGPFLLGVERNRRLKLGEEIEEWIVNTREELQARVGDAALQLAERQARAGRFDEGATLAGEALSLRSEVSYSTPEEYQRLHALLLAGGRAREAGELQVVARDLYEDLTFCSTRREARELLTFRHSLPPSNPVFVGREEELVVLSKLLMNPGCRLVTVVGEPGVGKTDLVVKLLREASLVSFFPDGRVFVPLEGVSRGATREVVLVRFLTALSVLAGSGDPWEQLVDWVGDKRLLLVLDNFEQLTRHAALLSELLRACPNLKLLVTSRVVLNLRGESVVRLDGLPYPRTFEQVIRAKNHPPGFAAVELFYLEAQRTGGRLTSEDLPKVAGITRLLDGLPLGIRLAAAWVHACSLEEISERIDGHLALLQQGNQDAPERHRSMLAAIDTSWDLLDPQEQQTWRRLAVFQGGFTRDSSHVITGADLPTLRRLVDRSLLRYDVAAAKYTFHPVLRLYAAEKLSERAGESKALHDKHADYYLGRLLLMHSAKQEIKNGAPKVLDQERNEIQAAWQWAAEHNWNKRLFEASLALTHYLDETAHHQEGPLLLAEAASQLDQANPAQHSVIGRLLTGQAWLMLRQGNYEGVTYIANKALGILEGLEKQDQETLSTCLNALGAAYDSTGFFRRAREYFQRDLELHKAGTGFTANAMTNLAFNAMNLGNYEKAERHLDQAHTIFCSQDKKAKMVWVAYARAQLYWETGDYHKALAIAGAALDEAHSHDFMHWATMLRIQLAKIHLAQGDIGTARALCEEMLNEARSRKKTNAESITLYILGHLEIASGAYGKAVDLFRMSLQRSLASGNAPAILYRLACLIKGYLLVGDSLTAARLYGYCTQEEPLSRMRFVHREFLEGLGAEFANQFLEYKAVKSEWCNLTLSEIAALVGR